jgi:hypothetical protein
MTTATKLNVGRAMARQTAGLDDLRVKLQQHCANGVPDAWVHLSAIFGDDALRGRRDGGA